MSFTRQQLIRALDNEEFVPHFQPLVDVRSGHLHGFEILARWQHPTLGFISPEVFIPLLEQQRLLNNLTAGLLIPAFHAAVTLPGDFGLSVNLSSPQLHDRSLPGLIQIMADEAGFDLKRLTIELTETALVDDLPLARKVAEEFKARGIRLALDDFGTGYSSLLHLQSLPFDELKVDASFVRSMTESRQSRKITAAVISLGLSLGLRTVAEGIEEQSQANLLAWQGCQLGQGYIYGRAVPASELSALLAKPHLFPGVTAEVPATFSDCFLALDARPMERFSHLRAIYDSAPVGLAFVNHELRYINLNQRLASSNGRSVQDHVGLKVSEVLKRSLYAQIEPYMLRSLQGESLAGIEVTKPSPVPGESPLTFVVSYEPVRDEDGEILGICVAIADMTALKQKEAALRESEDHYRHTVELNPQIPWFMEPDGRVIEISSRWADLTGMSSEQAKDLGWLNAIHPDDRDRVKVIVWSALQTGDPIDVECRLQSEGAWIWVRSRGTPRRNGEGRIIRWYGSLECIHEHKLALDELRCSEARLRAVFEAAPVGIALVESSTRRLLAANPRIETILGFRFTRGMAWSSEHLRLSDAHGNLLSPEQMPLARCIRSGETTDCQQLLLRRADGSSIWIGITVAPVRLENGTQWGAVVALQDIDRAWREHQKFIELTRLLETVASVEVPSAIRPAPWRSRME